MKISSILTAVALFGSLVAVAPASAQTVNGLGDARQRDLPSSVGALNEGRSYYGYRRYYRPYRPFYRAYRPRYYRYGY